MTGWLRQPWLHFIVLGALLFWGQRHWFPPPKPVIGPLSEARVDLLREQWRQATGQEPGDATLQRLVNLELEREILFQQALRLRLHQRDDVVRNRLLRNMQFLKLGDELPEEARIEQAMDLRLHLGDEVIKRRLVQVMEQLLLAANPPEPITEAAIVDAYEARRKELREPPRFSLSHVYFSREEEAGAEPALETIRAESLPPREAIALGSPFLPGYEFVAQSPEQLARQFGAAFVANLRALSPSEGQWVGPVRSTYGLHLVWVETVTAGRPSTLDEVRGRLRRDLEREARREALATAVDRLREQYEVRP